MTTFGFIIDMFVDGARVGCGRVFAAREEADDVCREARAAFADRLNIAFSVREATEQEAAE
jgi:hypothetical protein